MVVCLNNGVVRLTGFSHNTRPSVRVHWLACGACSVPGNFFQLGGSLRPFIILLVFVADITCALIG